MVKSRHVELTSSLREIFIPRADINEPDRFIALSSVFPRNQADQLHGSLLGNVSEKYDGRGWLQRLLDETKVDCPFYPNISIHD